MTTPTFEQSGYLSTLEDVADMLQRAQISIRKCPKQRLTEGYLKARIKSIEDYWDTFKQTHNNLTKCTPMEQRGVLPYYLNEEFYKFEELYLGLHADLTDLLSKSQLRLITNTSSLSNASQDSPVSLVKLPRIELPTFSGKYEDWPSYQDLFVALVHNTTMSDVQKLYYLKTSVRGDAEILLQNIKITETNYARAWDLLKTRFGNKRMIANSLLSRLFGQKKTSSQSAMQIKAILDTTMECLSSLNNLKISTDSWDPLIIFLVSQKLDTESLKDWEEQAYRESSEDMPKWDEMKKFLEFRFRTLELISPTATTSSRERQSTHKSFHVTVEEPESEKFQSAHVTTKRSRLCVYCKASEHYIQNCKDFIQQPVEERHSFIKNNGICFNCFAPNHRVFENLCKGTCKICRRRHNSLLHQTNQEKNEKVQETRPQYKTITALSRGQPDSKVILATAQVKIKGNDGEKYKLRALIDQGSEVSFISAGAAELLGLSRNNSNTIVSGVQEGKQIRSKYCVDLLITSRFNEDKEIQVKAYVLKTLSTILPSKHITTNWADLQTIQLADPTCFTPGGVDILLGADVFASIIEEGLIKIPDGVIAQKTCLGWIISGQQLSKSGKGCNVGSS